MDETILCEAEGVDGKLELLSDRIRIIREGKPFTHLYIFSGDKVIFLKYISALQFLKSAKKKKGFLQIESLGRNEDFTFLSIFNCENVVKFVSEQEPAFIKLRDMLEERLAVYHAPPQTP